MDREIKRPGTRVIARKALAVAGLVIVGVLSLRYGVTIGEGNAKQTAEQAACKLVWKNADRNMVQELDPTCAPYLEQ